jgi:hypothetical protein
MSALSAVRSHRYPEWNFITPLPRGVSTFLATRESPVGLGSSMVLNLSPLAATDAEVEERVDAMERARSVRETTIFDEVL